VMARARARALFQAASGLQGSFHAITPCVLPTAIIKKAYFPVFSLRSEAA
jgi:hypothetical protein